MLPTILAVVLATPPAPPNEQPATVPRAGPRDLVVELDQDGPDHITLDAQFRLGSLGPGVLRADFWDGENPGVELEFSVRGVPHVWLRQVEGEAPELWLSPDIEADPALMASYWGVMTDLSTYEATAKNPACKVLKYGLRALAWLAARACCAGFTPGCLVCAAGPAAVDAAVANIDCNKECKPDCPIP